MSPLPAVWPWLLRGFSAYSNRYLQRHFHGIRLANNCPVLPVEQPVVVYLNHASWWDPLVCLALKNRFFASRPAFAPIDGRMLQRYRFFARLGFFAVEQHTLRGAFEFLRTAERLLETPGAMLLITPQSRFADVRERPVRFAAGLGHLAARNPDVTFLPIALEYVFWQERLPEVLIRFGNPLTEAPAHTARDWTALLEENLSQTQDALATQAQRRDPRQFELLLHGRSGTTAVYDTWRFLRSALKGQQFKKEHGQ